jgi:RHS repeat-associated protein
LLTYGAQSFTYTANGELATRTNSTTGQTTTYRYDVLGNLTHVGLPGGRQIDYLIDGQNRRVGKLIDGVVQQFVYATHVNVPEYIIRGAALWLVITDYLGSVRRIVDSTSGAVLETVEYDAWGSVRSDTQPGLQPFGFAGGLFDRDTALVRFGARDYDASLGRWLAKDPLRFLGGSVSLYVYAADDPINILDTYGMDWLDSLVSLNESLGIREALQVDVGARGTCVAKCVETRRFDNLLIPALSAMPKRLLPPFRVPVPSQPLTTLPSTLAHYLGGRTTAIGSGLRGLGRVASKVATPLTIAEGFLGYRHYRPMCGGM